MQAGLRALSATLCFRFCTLGHIMLPTGGREGSSGADFLRGILNSRPYYGSDPGQIMGQATGSIWDFQFGNVD